MLMRLLKFFIKVAGVCMGITLFLFIVNLLQKGSCNADGRSMEDILGKERDEVKDTDLLQLKKCELMQVFYSADAPPLESIEGEYRSEVIPAGILGFGAEFFANNLFGPGNMVGKGFCLRDEGSGWGYNIFHSNREDGSNGLARTRKMDTYVGPSDLCEGDSLHLSYEDYNHGIFSSMHSEIRKINDSLYLGMVHLGIAGGKYNPTPFTLVGPPSEFQGPDS